MCRFARVLHTNKPLCQSLINGCISYGHSLSIGLAKSVRHDDMTLTANDTKTAMRPLAPATPSVSQTAAASSPRSAAKSVQVDALTLADLCNIFTIIRNLICYELSCITEKDERHCWSTRSSFLALPD
jgi:hypothetical protein